MTIRSESQRYGFGAVALGLAGFAIYMVMITVTLAKIEAMSGQIPFDMRLFGYSKLEATQLLDALGEDGRRYYLTRQIPLDTIYPALLAATLISAIGWLRLRLPRNKLMRVGIVCSVSAAVFDYVENLGVVAMVLNWPNLSHPLVYAASSASIAKSGMTTAAISIVLFLAALGVVSFIKSRHYPRLSSSAKKS
jgi:hypothetical protein